MLDFKKRFSECVRLFSEARDKSGANLAMIAFAADSDDERATHVFQEDDKHADLRSVSKVVTGLVLGNLILQDVKLGGIPIALETPVEPLLRQHMDEPARRQWRNVRIVDLLNNTIGHEEGFLFRKDLGDLAESDYLPYIFGTPVLHQPGHHFSYSNVGPFLFSVIIQDWLGKTLYEVAQSAILGPLSIECHWRKFGEYSAGCTGLAMRNGDLIKVANLLRDGGSFSNCTIVTKSWVGEMCAPRTLTPRMFDATRVFPKYAYGIGLWICQNGTYYCDGTNGQYLIVIPSNSVSISTTGDQPDMKPITKCMIPFTDG